MGKRLQKLVSVSIKWSFNFASILISLGFRNWTDATKWNNLVSSLILFIENISPFLIVSSPIAKSPQPHTVTIFGSRCRTYPIDGMLLLDLHNSSHLTQTHSITVKYMKYCDSRRFSIEEENFELVSTMLRRGVEKSPTLITSSEHYIIHDICSITFNPENWFL